MSIAIRLRSEAAEDLAEAAIWYERQRSGLGNEFLDRVVAAFDAISTAPEMFPCVYRNARRAFVRRFPFGIYYRIEGDEVVVVAIMHASRDPRRWKFRT